MAKYSAYILRCGDGSLYTGIARDVTERLAAHTAGRGAKYLRGRGPLTLLWSAVIGDRARAQQLEYRIKRLDRRQKCALVAGAIDVADLLADQAGSGGEKE